MQFFFWLHSDSGRLRLPVSPPKDFSAKILVWGLKRPKKKLFLFFWALPETQRRNLPLLL